MPTHFDGTDEERRALNAFIVLVRATDSVVARLSSYLTESGLTESQFGVIEALHHLGPMCQRELGVKNLKSSGNMTMVVDNLEKRGLVRRVRSEEDRRMVIIHLTDDGRALIERTLPQHVRNIAKEMSILIPEEQEALRRLCRTLGLQER
ncbi:MAG: MarR family transcriptional regulator [Candidatus Poribacteria bacterium]|nr:MarR family transcriptional regulator [Candidatus Poribacteria bacterium]